LEDLLRSDCGLQQTFWEKEYRETLGEMKSALDQP